jgi:phosphopantothenoylcysteine decarboxylase/phosphopantothenate--cysteine ligase
VRFVVTAGPTREAIDPVRFVSNRSSGKMGYAIADAAVSAGHSVKLISGPTCLARPRGARFIPIVTGDQLYREVHRAVRACDALVMCAAVADYKPAKLERRKMHKRKTAVSLRLIPTRDILSSVTKSSRKFLVIGFAAETHDLKKNAQKKLREKKCDLIVANDVSKSDSGMESDVNAVTIFFHNGESKKISRTSKKNIARNLVKIISEMSQKRLTKKA